jgi:uncharacterized RmlC-like cupin family protein
VRLASVKSRVPQIASRMDDAAEAIHVEVHDGKVFIVAGNGDVFWGNFEEHGTTNAPAHPFLIPAAEAHRLGAGTGIARRLKRLADTGR